MKITLKQGMMDLANNFLCRITFSDKKVWKQEDIIKEFQSAMYELTLYYLDELGKEVDGDKKQSSG